MTRLLSRLQRISIPFLAGYFFLRNKWPIWFYALNRTPRRLYRQSPPAFDDVQKRLVRDLKETGIAITHLDELFPGKNLLPELLAYGKNLMASNMKKSTKGFLDYVSDAVPVLDGENILVRLALDQRIIDVVNGYFDMFTRFFQAQLNVNYPMDPGSAPEHSQRWHRDLDDLRMCKIFVYFNDVDKDGGPFMFLPRSHYGGKWRNAFPQTLPFGLYTHDAEVFATVPKKEIKICTARAGTIIFCDVSGLHCGGYVIKTQRLMLTVGYRSDASAWHTVVKREESNALAQEEAIRGPAFRYAIAPFDARRRSVRLFRLFKKNATLHHKRNKDAAMTM